MSYGRDLANAARRHFRAAELLDREGSQGKPDVAGYLYGIAAECALKQIMWKSGMRPPEDEKKNHPFFLHFPELKTTLRDSATGRLQSLLLKYASDSRFMNEWDVKMRYAPSKDIPGKHVERWAKQAKELLVDMELL